MGYVRDQKTATQQAAPDLRENTGAGPLTPVGQSQAYGYRTRRVSARGRLEKIGFWIVVVAALALLLLLAGFLLPPIIGGIVTGFYTGAFVGLLTLMNLSRPSAWGNSLLGRKVFPVLNAPDNDVWRLAGINALLVFTFVFVFSLVAHFINPFFSGLVVFGALVAAGVFYSRARKVIIRP
jgi:hypothetical protein